MPTVTSTATIVDNEGSQLLAVGALVYRLLTIRRFEPYVTGGAGVLSNLGETPSVRLAGSYAFAGPGGTQFLERDTLTVNYTLDDREFVGLVGGGTTIALSPRTGIRVDVRTYFNKHELRTTVDTVPFVQVALPPNGIASTTVPSVQFTNNPTFFGSPSTLSGAALDGFETFKVSRWVHRVNLTAGYYFRF